MGSHKAPGPDGFPPLFYQKFCPVILASLMEFIFSIFDRGLVLPDINGVLLVLIPQLAAPKFASQFRPIALSNVVAKIVTKIVAN